jgi:shikimate kinase
MRSGVGRSRRFALRDAAWPDRLERLEQSAFVVGFQRVEPLGRRRHPNESFRQRLTVCCAGIPGDRFTTILQKGQAMMEEQPAAATIYLVGMRASGKSTLGRALAKRLNYKFVDMDILIREQSGMEVVDIVAREGWDGFREREARALREAAEPRAVFATGGGTVLREDNRAFMRRTGICVYLSATPEVLAARLLADPNVAQRPSLNGPTEADYNPASEVRETLRQRERLYQQAAHCVVDADQPLPDLVQAVFSYMEKASRQ